MKNVLKKMQFIILSIVVTFFVLNVSGTGLVFIQAISLAKMSTYKNAAICAGIYAFVVNPFLAVSGYFSIKKIIKKYSKQDYTDMEWAFIRLDIIMTQLAAINMVFPLAAAIYRRMFTAVIGGIFGRAAVSGIIFGMGVPLIIMLVIVCFQGIYTKTGKQSKCERQNTAAVENKKKFAILFILAVFMCTLAVTGIPLGNKIIRIPDFSEVLEKKTNIIKKNKDYIEKIREYVENLNFEELTAYGGQEEKDEDFDVIYREEKDYGSLILNTQKIMDEIGLKNKNVIDPEGKIVVEFDTKTYKIRKISISIEYRRLGYDVDVPVPSRLVWYSPDYTNRSFSWVVLDENWQIESPQY